MGGANEFDGTYAGTCIGRAGSILKSYGNVGLHLKPDSAQHMSVLHCSSYVIPMHGTMKSSPGHSGSHMT